jgi:hypothetical protein
MKGSAQRAGAASSVSSDPVLSKLAKAAVAQNSKVDKSLAAMKSAEKTARFRRYSEKALGGLDKREPKYAAARNLMEKQIRQERAKKAATKAEIAQAQKEESEKRASRSPQVNEAIDRKTKSKGYRAEVAKRLKLQRSANKAAKSKDNDKLLFEMTKGYGKSGDSTRDDPQNANVEAAKREISRRLRDCK